MRLFRWLDEWLARRYAPDVIRGADAERIWDEVWRGSPDTPERRATFERANRAAAFLARKAGREREAREKREPCPSCGQVHYPRKPPA